MMKKKNGFTLIELLVVIALMLSILGIAIVSLTGISDKKKKEAWKEVINQIETAATEYFTANEYLFEGLENGSTGTISVGRLVNEDYLNAVTNPVTEKKVSKCAIVNVTKNGDKYTSSFDERTIDSTSSNCDSQSLLITSNVGKSDYKDPNNNDNGKYTSLLIGTCYNLSGEEMDADDANGYCYSKKFQLDVDNINKKGALTSVKYCNSGNGSICKTEDSGVDITNEYKKQFQGYNDTTAAAITVVDLRNQSGALTRIITDNYKIDHDAPIVSISLESSDSRYHTADPTINIEGNDFGRSGISSYELEGYEELPTDEKITLPNSLIYNNFGELIEDFSGDSTNPKVKIYDKVGNEGKDETNYTVYKTCDSTITKNCEHSYTYSYDCDCDKKGENCDTCYGTGHYYNEYYIDEFNEAHCGGDTYCPSNLKPRSRTITAKAYKFSKEDKNVACKTKEAVNFNCNRKTDDNGNPIRCKVSGYYYRRYKFKELTCKCSAKGNNVTVIEKENLTEKTHPDTYSYLFYDKKKNCEKQTKGNIVQICTHKYFQKLKFHGVKWYDKENSKWQYSTGEEGYWYNDSYIAPEKEGSSTVNSEDKVCKWACEAKLKK